MSAAVIWSAMGDILHKCKDLDEAEEIIEDCDYEEISRITQRNGETNIVVLNF